ncbi:MAG: GNAT family N-acetyltransferase [Rickettsiales bacterium]|jgi:putative hemolysin|nr:GNAT family N-acetyltransferase [Rickettsiales bacterium]
MAIKVRDYEVRLTRTSEERRQVRQLRYRVYVEEEGIKATEEQKNLREEYDKFDTYAEYMAVFHDGRVVGTYRLIDRDAAEKIGGFYSEEEFNIKKLKNIRGNIIEMSRACVAPEYRDKPLVMSLLWLGLGDYVFKKKIVLLFGMCSWVGTNPAVSAQAISYLYYNHLAPISLRTTVLKDSMEEKGIDPKLSRMNILPKAFVNKQMARAEMTPLMKGYLNLGATFGNGISVDIRENSYTPLVIVQTKNIKKAYQKHFTGSENAFDELGIKPGAWKTFGKILISPVAGLAAIAKFFLKPEDAEAVERVPDEE